MTKPFTISALICLAVIVCNAWVQVFVLTGQKEHITRLQNAAARARSADRAADAAPGREPPVQAGQMIATIEEQIPSSVLFPEYAVRLRHMIDNNHLLMDASLVFMPADARVPHLLKYDTRITALGTYPRVKQLISDILNQPGLICVNGMGLESDPETRDRVRLSLNLSMFFVQGGLHAAR